MRRGKFAVMLLAVVTASLSGQTPQWTQLPGPSTAFVKALAVCADTMIYAGTLRGGVYEKSVQGSSWRAVNSGLTSTYVQTLAVDSGKTLYAGTTGKGVFRFNPSTRIWHAVNSGLSSYTIEALSGNSRGMILAATSDAGIFRTTNGGESWKPVNGGLTTTFFLSVLISNEGFFFAGSSGSGIFRSLDSGSTWSRTSTGLSDLFITSMAQDSGGGLWSATGSGLFHSTDNGTTWTLDNDGLIRHRVHALHVSSGRRLFTGTSGGVFLRDTAAGRTRWNPFNSTPCEAIESVGDSVFITGSFGKGIFTLSDSGGASMPASGGLRNSFARSLTATPDHRFIASLYNAGVFVSSDSGILWSDFRNGLGENNVEVLAHAVDGTVFAGTSSAGVFRRTPSDTTWRLTHPIPVPEIRSFFWTDDTLFVGTIDGLFFSASNGDSWTDVSYDLTATRIDALARTGQGRLLAGSPNGIFALDPNAQSWTRVLPTNAAQISFAVNALRIMDDGTAVAGTDHGIFVSEDSGSTWMGRSAGLTDLHVLSLAADSNTLIAGLWQDGVFRSIDHGHSWARAGVGIDSRSVWSLELTPDHRFLAGTYGDGIFLSVRSDLVPLMISLFQALAMPASSSVRLEWTTLTEINSAGFGIDRRRITPEPADAEWQSIAFVAGAGTSDIPRFYMFVDRSVPNGRYAYRIRDIASDGSTSVAASTEVEIWNIPRRLGLAQNFPNPFNPLTTIRIEIPSDGHYTLKVCDLLGRTIRVLLDGAMIPGLHDITFDATGLSSGVYLYTLAGPSSSRTLRMSLLR